MPEMFELWPGGPLFAQAEHFRLGTDSVLLADFITLHGKKRAVDLGCASGILSLLALYRYPGLTAEGLDIVPEAVELAELNMQANGLEERFRAVNADLRQFRNLYQTGSFDAVMANPPYFKAGAGAVSPDPERAAARTELNCTLEDICAAASYLLRTGGSLFLVNRPERLAELMGLMSTHGIEPKRLRFVSANSGKAPSLFLIEGKRGGSTGLTVEPQLYLNDPDGTESDEYKRIYHR